MIVRRVVRFGDDVLDPAVPGDQNDQINVQVKPSTALTGLGLWVAAGVLTHLAIRTIDGWLDRPRRP